MFGISENCGKRIIVFAIILVSAFSPTKATEAPRASVRAGWVDPGWRRTLVRYHVTFDRQGLSTTVYEFEYQAIAQKGVSSIAQMSFQYDGYYQSLSVSDLATVKADGAVIAVDVNALKDQPVSTDETSPYFDDQRVKLVAYPNVATGDKVRGRMTYTGKAPLLPGEFAGYWSESKDQPPETVQLTIDGPADRPLNIAAHGATHTKDVIGDRVVHHVVFKHDTPEPLSSWTDRFDSDDRFEVSTFKDYAAFAKAMSARNAPMAVPDDALIKLSGQIVGTATTPRLKAERIYDWVVQNIRYVGIGLKDGGLTSQPAQAILAARYGDCKAHVTILKALLAAQGIEVDFVAANLSDKYTLTQVATQNFDHAIAYIPSLDLFADPTSSTTPFGFLPPSLYGKPVLDIDRGKLLTIPVMQSADFEVDAQTHYTVLPNGTRKADSALTGTGVGEALTRGTAIALETIDGQELAKRRLADYGRLAGTGDYAFTDPRDLSRAFGISAPFIITQALDLHTPTKFRLLALTDPRRSAREAIGSGGSGKAFRCLSVIFKNSATLDFPDSSHVYAKPNREFYDRSFQGETPYGRVTGRAEISRNVVLQSRSLTSETRGTITFSAPVCPANFGKEIRLALEQFDRYELDAIGLTPSPVSRVQDTGSVFEEAMDAYRAGNYDSAMSIFRRLAEQGHADAQIQLGAMYSSGTGVSQNYKEALHWYELAAAQDDTLAQSTLGYFYDRGFGMPADQVAARLWFRKAADHGYDYAQKYLGDLYKSGWGGERDMSQAISWYEKAADQSNLDAQICLGIAYADGEGVPQDYAAALNWYSKAAHRGSALAQVKLGALYAEGRGVTRDYAEASLWFELAADKGEDFAQYNLGWMHENGFYFPKSNVTAIEWYKKAAGAGNSMAQDRLNILTGKSTPNTSFAYKILHFFALKY